MEVMNILCRVHIAKEMVPYFEYQLVCKRFSRAETTEIIQREVTIAITVELRGKR